MLAFHCSIFQLWFILLILNDKKNKVQMVERYIVNNYPDYNESQESSYLIEGQFTTDLVNLANRLIDQLYMQINKNIYSFNNKSDYSIYTGYCGIAYLYYFKYLKKNDVDSFGIAKNLIDKALSNLKGRDISFLLGDAGPLALGAVLYAIENDQDKVEDLIDRLIKLPEKITDYPDEILYGRAGYIYALLFVKKRIGNDIIPAEYLKKQVQYLINSGKSRAKKDNFEGFLKYEWQRENYLGAAHGLAGILYILLNNKDLIAQRDLSIIIKSSLDSLIAKRYPTGNFPSSYGGKSDDLVQWCHGAPGFVNLFTLASKVFRSDEYLQVAIDCGDVVWQRGLLQKGYSICHGVCGNAYTFSHLYQITNDIKHLHRLSCFLHWVTTYPKNQGMTPDRPLSMFEGISGVTYFLTDIQDLSNSSFPGYSLN